MRNVCKIGPLIIIAIAFLSFSSLVSCGVVKNIILSGFLEATTYNVVSEAQGIVKEVNNKEGDSVKKGEIFAGLDKSSYEFTVKQLEALVSAKNARLDEVVKGARNEELNGARAKVGQLKSAVESSNQTLEMAKVNYDYILDKYNKVKESYVKLEVTNDELKDAKYKLDSAKQALDDAKERVVGANAQLDGAKATYDLLANGASNETIRAARADLEQAQNQFENAKVNMAKCDIKIPANGVITVKSVNLGEVLNPGSTVAEVTDVNDLFVKLYFPQKYLSKVSIGQQVKLNSYSDRNLTVNGKVIYISQKAEFTPKNIETNEAKETTVFMVKFQILSNDVNFRPGMTLELPLEN